MDQKWNELKDKSCKLIMVELEKISNMPSLNDATLRNLQLLTDTKKNFLKIEKMEMELEGMRGQMDGNSYRGNSYDYIRGEWGNSMAQGSNSNRYNEPMYYGNSYANSYDGGYSMHGNDAYSHLEQAMRSAKNENEREAIRQAMSRIHM